uniref:Neprosin PEP catalytic domain-containing protein n=1 Tax=Ananas comosus var. bracteatus TaxID=296719 RepID=A0A6V7PBS3_ANACO|nr:unnamed protein product [Ananas comosus var. bracteatus]
MSGDPDLLNESGHQHAIAYVEGDKYYGAKATMNIWILGGSFGQDLNSIEAGWQVSPDLYGDNNTRLFTYWTSDAYQATGCYNLLCSGFIQINNDIAMGATIYPISGYGSPQYDISLLVWKDPKEGNWWMQFGNGYVLGYWPSFLFSYLAESASMIEWGARFGKASYFRNIEVVDGANNLRAPGDVGTFTEQSNCYDVHTGKGGDWGNYFYYGGLVKTLIVYRDIIELNPNYYDNVLACLKMRLFAAVAIAVVVMASSAVETAAAAPAPAPGPSSDASATVPAFAAASLTAILFGFLFC